MEESYFWVKLQAEVCNFNKINTPPWVFFLFFKLYRWYQITQSITNQKRNSAMIPKIYQFINNIDSNRY